MYLLSAKHGQYITILTDSPGLATQGQTFGEKASRERPFAEFTLSAANGLRVTGVLSKCLTQGSLPGLVMYVAVAVRGRAIHNSTQARLRTSHSPKNLVTHAMNQSFSKSL